MRYGNHSVENYDLEHPYDDRVVQARDNVAKLNAQDWKQEEGEQALDFRHRVQQTYDLAAEPYESADLNKAERRGAGNQWIKDRKEEIKDQRRREIDAQPNNDLKVGGRHAADVEAQRFEKDAREGKNRALNSVIDDLTNQQAARQEHITNDIVGPACEAKLKELGLDQVKEPERQPEPEQKPESVAPEDSANAQHIPEDLMPKAAETRVTPEVPNERLERLKQAHAQIGTPVTAQATQLNVNEHEQ